METLTQSVDYIRWIALLPLLGAILNGVIALVVGKNYDEHSESGQRLRKLVSVIAVSVMVGAFLIALRGFIGVLGSAETVHGHTVYAAQVDAWFTWFSAGGISADVTLVVDPLSSILLLIITGVGALIHLYSVGYMAHDSGVLRYFAYLNFFIFSMLMLVLADSLPLMFLGWEGVGVASYLLIGFYYSDDEKATAGKKAFIVNRVGDFAFILGMVLLFNLVGSLDFADISAWASHLTEAQVHTGADGRKLGGLITLICLLFFVGCTGKSAQIPLYVWLPDAMAGPTPVSALIHAATMVTAGVYLLARMNFLFGLSPTAMMVIAIIGALTAFFAATIGMTQFDIKKVLAYSTISQLGYMFLAVGSGAFFAGILHLMTHAFFKALLFLGSGSVIHGMHHEQDIRKMGGLKALMPITHITFFIGCLAIAGIPGLSGFFSKDEVLWFTLANQHGWAGGFPLNYILWGLGLATAGMTAFYMFRLYFLTFSGESRADEETKSHIHESPWQMTVPLAVLAVLSIIGGFVGLPHIINFLGNTGQMHPYLHDTIAPGEQMFVQTMGNGMAWAAMGIATLTGLGGIALAWVKYGRKAPEFSDERGALHNLVFNKYYVDEFYQKTVVRGVGLMGTAFHKIVDEFLIDAVLVNGVANAARFGGVVLRQFQSGNVQRYVVYVVLGVGAILLLL